MSSSFDLETIPLKNTFTNTHPDPSPLQTRRRPPRRAKVRVYHKRNKVEEATSTEKMVIMIALPRSTRTSRAPRLQGIKDRVCG